MSIQINTPDWILHANVPLRDLNTFHIQAQARWLLEIIHPTALPQALTHPHIAGLPVLVLGSGSNVLLAANPENCVLHFVNRDVTILEHRINHALVRAGAGMAWHDLVLWSLQQGLSGLENLALIPGTVGACSIHNIGAYGVQVDEFVHVVEAYDQVQGKFVRLPVSECGFAYRDSRFKREPDRYLIVAVEFRLPLLHELKLNYAGITEELEALQITLPEPRDIAQAVINLRRRKLPDPDVLSNAGSFFKNPHLPHAQAEQLRQHYPTLPIYPGETPASSKLSAAWLIEQCGWKGVREGDAGVAPQHALVLVNYGEATGAELLALARRIAASVQERFGVAIEPEPRLIGAHW
ncbi:UDP-N-acetylmuramate dehydrogenase [Xylella taiwanensis]|uniref:UDP-N-acetylenolpyruvoylglucosamine reductase n=1 Tax=Xylella taiwanensis TaxID=1444770 RepID=Z9JH14_9GAMM|nr:UDP-N-acetylmuramate dehydrogenase [Xylella taiwanensis]AXI84265.1 UDP-N-acetylenolpyruvoylglucosamine reductase [Xylella taiwanensis]EWS77700.1 UDP-N-acetylenolpyruvoylglucosamine reductase [Xylella taiwanensis]MCD8457382.1 UDP-N-acetylmuramate dehydrogenase [Xylella taiwanensis]MCD8457540.1 UDP-N-acetylmuramate dehydrogenase [Xylella taiwanensis]MCD8461336.1 UDP-N-acetylmuramate dehydrogenase [Xylella taiwanensis]